MDLAGNQELPEAIVDPKSGLAINHPVTIQNYPRWWEVQPDLYQHIMDLRKQYGIEVDDGIEQWQAAVEQAHAEFQP